MKLMKLISSLLLPLLSIKLSLAQQERLIISDSAKFLNSKIITLNEIHGIHRRGILKRLYIEQLTKRSSITDIVLEIGKSEAYLYNEYIASGNSALLTEYMLYSKGKNIKEFWQVIRNDYVNGIKIKVHGIDFERTEFITALKLILEKQGKSNSKLYAYLKEIPDSIVKLNDHLYRQERMNFLRESKNIYQRDKNYYDSAITDAEMVGIILENPVLESKFGKRFREMEDQFYKLYNNEGHKYLLIIGRYHVETSRPIYHTIKAKYKIPDSEICITSIVAKDCTAYGYGADLTKIPLNGNEHILKNAKLVGEIFKEFTNICDFNLLRINDKFMSKYNIINPNHIDYIIPIDCAYSEQNCGK